MSYTEAVFLIAICVGSTQGSSSGTLLYRNTDTTGVSSKALSTYQLGYTLTDHIIRPNVHFHCNIPSDPFLYMQDHNKTYGFTITMYEFESTIRSLWQTVREYMSLHPEQVHPDNAMGFISEDNGAHYNLCHFWSNFEIADMDFWRSETYMMFFEFLDSTGGFYYEATSVLQRWGDAPVHSIAASLFLPKDAIHFFDEIGYQHIPFTHCTVNTERWQNGRCSCDPSQSFDYNGYSCLRQWEAVAGRH
ncbi:family 15 glycosyltransferase [Pisolithus albus]|nr:family 15 glycosyltransferase [Pisolithus albus]